MSVVHRGVPDGNEIMQKFGGDAKKKIFLYLKRGRQHLCSHPPFDRPKLTVAAVKKILKSDYVMNFYITWKS